MPATRNTSSISEVGGSSAVEHDVMDWVEAWVNEHVSIARHEPSADNARARELSAWLRRDAAGCGISNADIDAAIAGSIGAGHGLVAYVSDAMAKITNATVSGDV